MRKKVAAPPKYFTKARVANIMSAVVISVGLYGFMFMEIPTGSREVVAGLMGFAAKHLWDSCNGGD